ncbi:hypothetical protein F5Y08DRAFT_337977 [Xylaria arbuscula]|nr:hypothetical protein F5Y08DRAFT_337977 [Xylaria arbuscula]
MAPEMDSDPPPSYAEATGMTGEHHSNNQIDNANRRHTLAAMIINPIYSHLSSTSTNSSGPGNSPLYAVTTHALYTQPDMVIHRGITRDSPSLAMVYHQPFSRSASVTLPARPGSRFPVAHELLESIGTVFRPVVSFSIETTSSGRSREHFEWRHSSGVEVEALGGRHSGWKLVRVSVPPLSVLHPSSLYAPLKRKFSSSGGGSGGGGNVLGQSSDGKEVVAVWSEVNWSLSKILRFRFLGSGADGSLRERWAVMAVASALAIWHRERRSRSTVGGSAGF